MPKTRRTEKLETFESFLSILGYKEDGEWVALALEMDLRGYGSTWEAALEELSELVMLQVEFAIVQGERQMMWKDAEPQYWERFREIQRAVWLEPSGSLPDFHATGLVLPPAHVIAAQRSRFEEVNG